MAIEVNRKSDKVCICGFAPSYKEAPWDAPPGEYEIWCLNEMYKLKDEIPNFHADKWFEIHDRNSPSKATPEHQHFLKNCPCPVFMWQKYDDIPNSIELPIYDIIKHFEDKGYNGARYITNSVSIMIMYAIYQGFKEISVYGVDLSTDAEWSWQKPSCEYWLGVCNGLGIKLYIPQSSELLKCGQIYGFESNNKITAWIKSQVSEFTKRSQRFAQQQMQAQQAAHQAEIAQAEIRGAKAAYQEILKRRQ